MPRGLRALSSTLRSRVSLTRTRLNVNAPSKSGLVTVAAGRSFRSGACPVAVRPSRKLVRSFSASAAGGNVLLVVSDKDVMNPATLSAITASLKLGSVTVLCSGANASKQVGALSPPLLRRSCVVCGLLLLRWSRCVVFVHSAVCLS